MLFNNNYSQKHFFDLSPPTACHCVFTCAITCLFVFIWFNNRRRTKAAAFSSYAVCCLAFTYYLVRWNVLTDLRILSVCVFFKSQIQGVQFWNFFPPFDKFQFRQCPLLQVGAGEHFALVLESHII